MQCTLSSCKYLPVSYVPRSRALQGYESIVAIAIHDNHVFQVKVHTWLELIEAGRGWCVPSIRWVYLHESSPAETDAMYVEYSSGSNFTIHLNCLPLQSDLFLIVFGLQDVLIKGFTPAANTLRQVHTILLHYLPTYSLYTLILPVYVHI